MREPYRPIHVNSHNLLDTKKCPLLLKSISKNERLLLYKQSQAILHRFGWSGGNPTMGRARYVGFENELIEAQAKGNRK